ncbi:MAG: ABC transporter substrate-binding protein [Burkholderiales bacterium]|jgi:peptide/nickel transport system substrate-binding protein
MKRLIAATLLSLAAPLAGAQTLKVVMHSDLKVLDPLVSTQYIVRNHGLLVWDQLVAMDAKGQVRPQMAERWDVSPDGLTYTFRLRDGLEWHDGTPVTAEDCIASIRRFVRRDPTGLRLAPNLKSLDALDARTFRLVLKEPYGMVLETLAKPSLSPMLIMPKRVAETDPAEPIKPEQVVGSGPFVFKRDEWKPGERVVYVKNPKYRPRAEPPSGFAGGKVAMLERIEWVNITDPQTAVSALIRGEVDMVEAIPADLLPLVEKEKGLVVKPFTTGQYFARMNHAVAPFDNPKIRQAAMIALSQEQTLRGAVGDAKYWNACRSMYACGSPLATDVGMKDLVRGDAKRAAALLKEAGYDGTPVVMPYPTDLGPLAPLGPLAKQQLERAGFKVQLAPMDWQSMGPRLRKKDKPSEGGWSMFMSFYDARDALDPIGRTVLNTNCKTSFLGWPCDDKFEGLRDAFTRTTDPEARRDLARQIQERNNEVVVFVPMGEARFVGALSRALEQTFDAPVTLFWGLRRK